MAQRRPDRLRGPAHDQFWTWCSLQELRLQQCGQCSRISWPPVQCCEYCGHDQLAWQRMSGEGRLTSWCTFERDYYQGVFPIPWDTILVELAEGVLFISNPLEFGWRDITPQLPVRLAFIECEDSTGSFMLPVFRQI